MPTWLTAFRKGTLPPSTAVVDSHFSTLGNKLDEIISLQRDNRQGAMAGVLGHVTTDEIRTLFRMLAPRSSGKTSKCRVGSTNDGGYVMLRDFGGAVRALSLGIDFNDEWDRQIAERGIRVDQYDDSVVSAPTQHPLLTFRRQRVCALPSQAGVTLDQLLASPEKCLLKMDIEGSEWESLANTSSERLANCTQIVCEFHDLRRLRETSFFQNAASIFEKVLATHYPVHIHANNYSPVYLVAGIPVPDVVEMTFVLKSQYPIETSGDGETYPGAWDTPNNPSCYDIDLAALLAV